MFGAEVIRTLQQGQPRIGVNLGGQMVFIARAEPDGTVADPPAQPHLGLEHIGLIVEDIDDVAAGLKAKGAEFTMEPPPSRPNTRIAFLKGPENVSIELVNRNT